MRVNPFYDSWLFLIGRTGPHLGVGEWRYLLVSNAVLGAKSNQTTPEGYYNVEHCCSVFSAATATCSSAASA